MGKHKKERAEAKARKKALKLRKFGLKHNARKGLETR